MVGKRKQYLAVVIIVVIVVLVIGSVYRVVVKRQPRSRGGFGDTHDIIEARDHSLSPNPRRGSGHGLFSDTGYFGFL